MPKRYWLSSIAFGLILAGSPQAQGISNDASGNAKASHSQSKPKADAPPVIPVAVQNDIQRIARALESANQKQPSGTEEDRAKRNLKSQEEMSFWAALMFWVALAETLVTGLGVFLVWRTLRATWAAKNEAKRAADAAHATVASMEDTARRQLRAYLVVRKTRLISGMNTIKYLVHNTGTTPAKNLVVSTQTRFCKYSELSDIERDATPRQTFYVGGGLDISFTVELTDAFNPKVLEENNSSEGRTFFMLTRIDYTDIFNQPQWATSRCYLGPGKDTDGNIGFYPCAEGNDAS